MKIQHPEICIPNGQPFDSGLLPALFDFSTKQALLNGDRKNFAKDGIYENIVAETFVKTDQQKKKRSVM